MLVALVTISEILAMLWVGIRSLEEWLTCRVMCAKARSRSLEDVDARWRDIQDEIDRETINNQSGLWLIVRLHPYAGAAATLVYKSISLTQYPNNPR